MIEFVCASHNENILEDNLLKSSIFKHRKLTVLRGFDNVAKAYNSHKPTSSVVVYVHHDVFLPDNFENSLLAAVFQLHTIDKNWGALGSAGVKLEKSVKKNYGYISDRGNIWGSENGLPKEVQTLDELILITKGDLIFDENLPQDFYGADLCMQNQMRGRKNYAIKAFCHHNSGRAVGGRTDEFYKAQDYFENKWKDHKPIVTTCSLLT